MTEHFSCISLILRMHVEISAEILGMEEHTTPPTELLSTENSGFHGYGF